MCPHLFFYIVSRFRLSRARSSVSSVSMLSGAGFTAKGSSAGVFGPRVSNTALLENGDPREVVRGPPPLARSYPSSRHRANMQTPWGETPDYLKHDIFCPDFLILFISFSLGCQNSDELQREFTRKFSYQLFSIFLYSIFSNLC